MKYLLLTGFGLWLSACAFLPEFGKNEPHVQSGRNRESAYLGALPESPLIIPADLDGEAIGNLLPIPATEGTDISSRSSRLAAPDSLLAPEILDQIRIQTIGDASWLVSPENPSTVWPKLVLFVSDYKLGIRRNEPAAGILETEWFNVGSDFKDKFLQEPVSDAPQGVAAAYRVEFRVEQAIRKGFTEVHLQVFRKEGETFDPNVDSASPGTRAAEREVELLRIIASGLLIKDKRISVSLMANTINAEPKAILLRNAEGQPRLHLKLNNQRFFATIRQSLKNAEIEIESVKDDNSVIRIAFDKNLISANTRSRRQGRSKEDTQQLDLHLNWADSQGSVAVTSTEQTLDPEYAEQILSLLREYAL